MNRDLFNWDSGKSEGVTDHGNLDGLSDDDHSQYLNEARHDKTARHTLGDVVPHDTTKVGLSGDETIADIKTFSSIPVLPASDPTTDNQAVRKAYVDDRAGLGGWIEVSGWSYASESTINVPSGAASIYSVGDQLRWKQGGGYKYGVVKAVADSLLTIIVNTSYTVANSAITDAAFSKVSGVGFPTQFVFNQNAQGFSTKTIDTGYYQTSNRLCKIWGRVQGVSNNSILKITLPVQIKTYEFGGWEYQPTLGVTPCLLEPSGSVVNIYRNGGVVGWPTRGNKDVLYSLVTYF